jgi:tRNA nucleotidyltransferase (CCA-adding enzyme)
VEKILLEFIDVFTVFIPEFISTIGFNNSIYDYDFLNHTVKTVINTPDILTLRLAALFHDIGKPLTFSQDEKGLDNFYGHEKKSAEIASIILKRLKYDNYTICRVTTLILYHNISVEENEKIIKRLLNKLSYDLLNDLFILKKADILAQNSEFVSKLEKLDKIKKITEKIISEGQCYSLNNLAINGNDLVSEKVPEGKHIGIILNYLLNAVIDGEFINEKEVLLEKAKIYYNTGFHLKK